MKKKLLTILLCLTISGTLLAGCQSTSDSSTAETTDASTSAASSAATESAADGDTITGQVTSVDGSTITLALGEMKEKPSNGGTPPEGMSEPSSGDMPEPSSDSMSDNQAPPDNNGGIPGGINLTGEKKTITIDDSTELLSRGKGESTTATLEDITTDCVLTIVMDGDTVKTVTISGFGNGNRQGKNKNDSSSETNDISDTEISTDVDNSDAV